MADIFVSYKKEDAGRVVRIVEGLRAEGLSVWWDHGIAPGSQWDQTIQTELNAAGMVVACWSELSISAPWVKEEAGVGKAKGKLLPVRIDDVDPPLGFGLIQMADLIDWDGDTDDPHWEHFIAAVRATLSGEPVAGLEKPVKKKSLWPVVALATVGLLAVGGVVAFGMGMLDSVLGRDTPAASGPIGAVVGGPTPPRQPSEAEKTMFAKAQDSRLKTDYQDYLRSFPQGAYAKQIREEILPICAGEMQKVWKPPQMPLGQMFRSASVTDGPGDVEITYDNKAAACSSAQDAFKASAESYCLAFTNSLETRNREVGYTIQDCVCQEAGGNWWCYTDSTYSCTYEFQTEQYVEVCG